MLLHDAEQGAGGVPREDSVLLLPRLQHLHGHHRGACVRASLSRVPYYLMFPHLIHAPSLVASRAATAVHVDEEAGEGAEAARAVQGTPRRKRNRCPPHLSSLALAFASLCVSVCDPCVFRVPERAVPHEAAQIERAAAGARQVEPGHRGGRGAPAAGPEEGDPPRHGRVWLRQLPHRLLPGRHVGATGLSSWVCGVSCLLSPWQLLPSPPAKQSK